MYSKSASRGFTLLELMTVITILAIVTALALPNIGSTIRANRITTAVNEVNATFSYAKTEAIRTNASLITAPRIDIVVCPANADASGCGANFDNGVIVARRSANNVTDVLRHALFPDQVMASADAPPLWVFDHRGRVNGEDGSGLVIPPPTLVVEPEPGQCKSNERLVSTITLTASGQFRAQRTACGE